MANGQMKFLKEPKTLLKLPKTALTEAIQKLNETKQNNTTLHYTTQHNSTCYDTTRYDATKTQTHTHVLHHTLSIFSVAKSASNYLSGSTNRVRRKSHNK
jgi:hypothetical protein